MPKAYTPLFKQFIGEIEKGFYLLDSYSQNEIREFVRNQQHINGSFVDRAGNPDIYYSLFGTWLSFALKLSPQLTILDKYINTIKPNKITILDKFALLLIRTALESKSFSRPPVFSLLKSVLQSYNKANPVYQTFIFLLTLDAMYPGNRFFYSILSYRFLFHRYPENLPCSVLAAILVAKLVMNRKINNEKGLLFSYYEKGKGFRAFKGTGEADLLSTAVALFALKKAGADLRIIAPDTLQMVKHNYASGAFTAGSEDPISDLEYTFYGLMALGTLT